MSRPHGVHEVFVDFPANQQRLPHAGWNVEHARGEHSRTLSCPRELQRIAVDQVIASDEGGPLWHLRFSRFFWWWNRYRPKQVCRGKMEQRYAMIFPGLNHHAAI